MGDLAIRQAQQPTADTHVACESTDAPDDMSSASNPPRLLLPGRVARGDALLTVVAIALVSLVWLLLILTVDRARFVVAAPQAKTGYEVLLAVGQLFGALVLAIIPSPRLRWAALGLFVLGIGALGFAYLYPLIDPVYPLEIVIYGSWFTRTAALALVAVSVIPRIPPVLTLKRVVAVVASLVAAGAILAGIAESLPALIYVESIAAVISGRGPTMPGLTAMHWSLAPIPLLLGVSVTLAALYRFPGSGLGGWHVSALALFTGAQLHSIFWPSLYSSILTSASVLRLAFTLVLVTGGLLELRSLLAQRDALLAEEQERLRHLKELGRMKDDFTAIVAHELASPVGAVGALADILALPDLAPGQRSAMTGALRTEARMLHTLVADVQAASAIERDDFTIHLRPVPVAELLGDVTAFADTLEGCLLETEIAADAGDIHVDPERIGQVLRNLLANACKHTPPNTRVVLRAHRQAGGVRIEVEDDGPGIAAEDHARIFEKYGRGYDREHHGIRGRGLGLYIARRIVELHGSELRLRSSPGDGATFWFDLEAAP